MISKKTRMQQLGLPCLVMTVALIAGCSSNTATDSPQKNTRMKAETIKQEGKFGTIQEERVKAMSSETRYIPSGSKNGYALIDPSLADAKENAHRDPEQPMIGSFTIGRW